MMRGISAVALLALSMLLSSCYRVSLKEEVFSSQPLWDSSKMPALLSKECADKTAADHKDAINKAPGLALLVRQVFGRDLGAPSEGMLSTLSTESDGKTYKFKYHGLHVTSDPSKSDPSQAVLAYGETKLVASDDQPLHPRVAYLDVTKAMVRSLEVSYLRANYCQQENLEDMKLSRSDFEDFATEVVKTTLALEREALPNGQDRLKKVVLAQQNKKITLDGMLLAYLTAYYNGKFVDRAGGTSQKPKLGLTITNETITAFLHVAIEALADYAIVDSKKVRVPIVFEGTEETENPTSYINSSKQPPTLAGYIMKIKDSKNPYMKYVVEPVRRNNEIGISTEKLEYIRYASGLAADSSQALSGAIVRLLGGANIGFGFMGKFSFGDNETLSKVADTIVEGLTRRSTESFASHVLYGIEIPQGTSVPEFLATK